LIVVGERANVSGSRTFERLVRTGDWDGAIDFALPQSHEGASVLDVCLISPDELRDTEQFYSRAALRSHPPWMIDSRSPEVMESALQICGSGHFLNSTSLEDPRHLDHVCGLAKVYRAGIVIACRDAAGLAMTRHRKLDVVQRTLDRIHAEVEPVIVDLLAFPVAAFPEGLAETLAAIEGVRGARTLLALSNFSFGMPPAERVSLEKRILNDASSAGLDFVILNTRRHRQSGVYDTIPIV